MDWEIFEGQDVLLDEPPGKTWPAASEAEILACREECLALGYGAFAVKRSVASPRPLPRAEVLDRKLAVFWARGTALHVAPSAPKPEDQSEGDSTSANARFVVIRHGELMRRASAETLAAKSGYFEAAFRHDWSDGDREEGSHTFEAFPGGERNFELALAWLAAEPGFEVGGPWPISQWEDVREISGAATYLDAPRLLRAAARSWRLALPRNKEELLRVAAIVVTASLQFVGAGHDLLIEDLQAMLQELPKHQLVLSEELLAAPAAGLAVLEVRDAARQTLVGHIRTVGGWVNSVIGGSDRARNDARSSFATPHEFATQLFARHGSYFEDNLPALMCLFRHIDTSMPTPEPLCFSLAAAAAAINEEGKEDFMELARNIFEHGIGASLDPAQAAADEACVVGLFGAGTRQASPRRLLSLDVLARPLVPPAAAAVILSRVLSSWASGESKGDFDAAGVILAGVVSNRQGLRSLLEAVLPRIAERGAAGGATEWGDCFDYAVPELRAAFAWAAADGHVAAETLSLLFRILFEPSGGLQGIHFPVEMLRELRSHSEECRALARQSAMTELGRCSDGAAALMAAEKVWPIVTFDELDARILEDLVALIRQWLTEVKSIQQGDERIELKARALRLLQQLPLHQLPDPVNSLRPPVPSHALAALALQTCEEGAARLAALEVENAGLRREVAQLRGENRGSG